MEKVFHVDGLRYKWYVDPANRVSFCLEDSNDKLNLIPLLDRPNDWEWDRMVRVWGVSGLAKNPLRVWREVARITVEWLRQEKPSVWSFSANEARKTAVYHRMARRLIGLVENYRYHEHDGGFYFYRIV